MIPIYFSAPGLVSCAGNNKDELYDSCLKGNSGRMGNTEKNIFKLIDSALEQIRSEIERAISFYGHDKIGVCFGTCDNGSEASIKAHREYFKNGKFSNNYSLHHQSASFAAEYIANKFGIKGPVMTIATACASSASAIIKGAELVRAGVCGAVIAGGADIVSKTVYLGFHALEAVSDELTNPFSKNRKGINLGEGAAFFLLDSQKISDIELLGYGESADAHHITAPGIDGAGPAKAMKEALANAGLTPDKIGYVNLHGTGTELNDKAEAQAMNTVFGNVQVPASSTKPITGHTLGAAGAMETAICWMVLNEGKKRQGTNWMPVHCWDGEKDDNIPMSSIAFQPCDSKETSPSICMNNNFAFGGCNVSLILGQSRI